MDESKEAKLFFNMVSILKHARRMPMQQFSQHGHGGYGKQRVLKVIYDHKSVTQSELAEILDIRPSSVSEMIRKLEKNELVERTTDENDRRVTNVTLTDKGRAVFEDREEKNHDAENPFGELFEGLSDDEKDQFLELTNKVLSNLKDDSQSDFDMFNKRMKASEEMKKHFHGPRGWGFGGDNGSRDRFFRM
ncbi:MarR family winged helix-turn-helix transcriptional regulator [Pediococcus argentinicus]|uniref:HTH marR-type domain-containing protein n=1 Tax=Pediococcus argentinicus TaxID=480391 RepID=A0A0R2NGM4_9LACO|nr:MarR family transcriptional regulator [Pediococcus argentinicus]KRO24948.1 hypothetical protein IV88_GL000514 [Pediococcus argentinicus]NKZ22635.1 MarR family transcriptional regulator [Pediococcus argentinicus]GEP19654.1 MarR family transcriptional regulator [Pediococcus argentinicus]